MTNYDTLREQVIQLILAEVRKGYRIEEAVKRLTEKEKSNEHQH